MGRRVAAAGRLVLFPLNIQSQNDMCQLFYINISFLKSGNPHLNPLDVFDGVSLEKKTPLEDIGTIGPTWFCRLPYFVLDIMLPMFLYHHDCPAGGTG